MDYFKLFAANYTSEANTTTASNVASNDIESTTAVFPSTTITAATGPTLSTAFPTSPKSGRDESLVIGLVVGVILVILVIVMIVIILKIRRCVCFLPRLAFITSAT